MIFSKYSYILTEDGFRSIANLFTYSYEDCPAVGYINEDGHLDFTKDYKIVREKPDRSLQYSDGTFFSFICDDKATFYINSDFKEMSVLDIDCDKNNLRNFKLTHNCFSDIEVNDVKTEFKLNDGTIVETTYVGLIKLFILYLCFGPNESISNKNSIRLYVKSSRDFKIVSHILFDILGKGNFSIFKVDGGKSTFYIDSEYLKNYFIDNPDKLMSNFLNSKTVKNSAYLVSYALQSIAEEFNYYDIDFPEAKILFGNNLNKSVIYLSACLSVCGFKFYCQRQRNGRYKMMFSKSDTHRFVNNVVSSENTRGDYYFRILTKGRRPIYVLEERQYIYNTHIIPTSSYKDTYLDKKDSGLSINGLI